MNLAQFRSVVFAATLASALPFAAHAQNATSGGDQQPQPDAQMRRGPGGPGGRRGGGVRGTVTAVNGSTVMLKTDEGQAWSVVSTDNTRVRRDGEAGTMGGIKPGDQVAAMGMPDPDKHEVHAMFIMDVSAAELAKAKANLGKTYIAGRITAINDTQLTVMRSDKVSQVISLDDSTSLHRGGRPSADALAAAGLDMGMMSGGTGMGGGYGGGGRRNGGQPGGAQGGPGSEAGESITLADVKVGEAVVGTGSVKGGSFVPSDLHVMERPAGGRRGGAAGMPPSGDLPQ